MCKRTILAGCALGVGVALLADGLVVLLIHNVWRVAQALAGDHIGAVLRQLTEAKITLPWLFSAAFALAIAAAWFAFRNIRGARIAAVTVAALACMAITFLTTAVNDIPMHIALKALLGLVNSGVL